jgi:hypothetical protein
VNGSVGVALGKYQFMPSVLRGDKNNKGLAEQVFGPDWKSQLFSKENQERLHDAFFKNEVNQLKKYKVPISEATIYMTHFMGPAGAAKAYFADDNVKMSKVMSESQVKSNESIAKLTVGEYKKRISTSKGNVVGLSFQEIEKKKLDEFLSTPTVSPVSSSPKVGDKIDFSSQEYADAVKQLKQNNASTIILNNNNVNVGVSKAGNTMVPPTNDSSRFVNGVRR